MPIKVDRRALVVPWARCPTADDSGATPTGLLQPLDAAGEGRFATSEEPLGGTSLTWLSPRSVRMHRTGSRTPASGTGFCSAFSAWSRSASSWPSPLLSADFGADLLVPFLSGLRSTAPARP